jgi:hypothetical protein
MREELKSQRDLIHDLATPLGTAVMLSEYLLEKLQTGEIFEDADVRKLVEIQRALRRAAGILQKKRHEIDSKGRI